MAKGEYELMRLVVSGGTVGGPRAEVTLSCPDGTEDTRVVREEGVGMIDATFRAIGLIVGLPVTVEKYNVQALGKGSGALGLCSVRVRNGGSERKFGEGRDQDVVTASALAYLQAVNKILAAKFESELVGASV